MTVNSFVFSDHGALMYQEAHRSWAALSRPRARCYAVDRQASRANPKSRALGARRSSGASWKLKDPLDARKVCTKAGVHSADAGRPRRRTGMQRCYPFFSYLNDTLTLAR